VGFCGRSRASLNTTGLSWGLGEWAALWFVVDVGDVLPQQRAWSRGVGAALRCKHFDARGKKRENRPDGPDKMSYGAIGKAGAGASGSYRGLTL
jgi:hypothetical protein